MTDLDAAWVDHNKVVDVLVNSFTEGIALGVASDAELAAEWSRAVVSRVRADQKFTREKVIELLAVAGVRMARALHEGDWT